MVFRIYSYKLLKYRTFTCGLINDLSIAPVWKYQSNNRVIGDGRRVTGLSGHEERAGGLIVYLKIQISIQQTKTQTTVRLKTS